MYSLGQEEHGVPLRSWDAHGSVVRGVPALYSFPHQSCSSLHSAGEQRQRWKEIKRECCDGNQRCVGGGGKSVQGELSQFHLCRGGKERVGCCSEKVYDMKPRANLASGSVHRDGRQSWSPPDGSEPVY